MKHAIVVHLRTYICMGGYFFVKNRQKSKIVKKKMIFQISATL